MELLQLAGSEAALNLSRFQADYLCRRNPMLSPDRAAHLLSLPVTDVHISRALETVLVAYKNRDYVADLVMPVIPVSKRFDQLWEFPVDTMQTVAAVQMSGPRARPGEIKYRLQHSLNYNVKDYGLIDFVAQDEIDNADPPLQPLEYAGRILRNALLLAREVRVAGKVFATGSFGSNTSALSGSARWDTSTGDPVSDILTSIESCFVRPNKLVIGGQVWPKFRTNPNVTKYILGRPSTKAGATPLVVDPNTVAQAFELDEVVIGRAKINSAAEGATVSSSYIWGKSAALIKVDDAPNPRDTDAFGFTTRFRQKELFTRVIPELVHGVAGGQYVKVTGSDDELVVGGGNSGYLLTTVIS